MELTLKQQRIIEGLGDDNPQRITFSHSTMCQTSLPFKNTHNLREWESRNGNSYILLEAGKAFNPESGKMEEIGLPYGPKPRLVLMHLNQQALLQGSREIEVENSMGAFIRRIGLHANGKNYLTLKTQLARLAASHIMIGRVEPNGSGTTEYARIVDKLNVFFGKDDNQRVLWPNYIYFSQEYFSSLQQHAVPLDERALHLLKDSALELDLYTMFAERLHRVPKDKPQFVPWQSLYEQYGKGYSRIRFFRKRFIQHLDNVRAAYSNARIEEISDNMGRSKGLKLYNSAPPVTKLLVPVQSKLLR